MLYTVLGKASDWFQKGAVIGYQEKEIQVSAYPLLTLVYSLHLRNCTQRLISLARHLRNSCRKF
jgi:hypothetical protein